MSLFEKLVSCEGRVIDWLTAFCWWTEVRFEKDNMHWAVQIKILENILHTSAWVYASTQLFMSNHPIWAILTVFLSLCLMVVIHVLIFHVEKVIQIIKNEWPQGFPNPSREIKLEQRIRDVLGTFFLLWVTIISDGTELIFFSMLSTGGIFSLISNLLLCCDSIPPHEKEKRKARIESWDSQLVPNVS